MLAPESITPTERWAPITFLKGDKHGSEVDYRDYLPVNVSGVVRNVLGAEGYMLQEPGLTQYATVSGIDRGGLWNERFSNHFRLSGTDFIEVSATGIPTSLGTISGTDTASFPYSFNTQGIVANGNFYLYSPSGGFSQVNDPDLGSPIDCVWVDGYYFFTDGEFLYHTDINDETAIDPLRFATSEFSPDPTLGVGLTNDDKVLAFNRYSIEYFINQANENFAFGRLPSRSVKYGIVGTHCKSEIGGNWFFMGGAKEESVSIFALGVGTVRELASREVVKLVNEYSEAQLSTAVLETRVEDDYQYLIVHLPNEVLMFNFKVAGLSGKNQAWSILKSDVVGEIPWRAIYGVFEPRKSQWVYGDKQAPILGILDNTVATHYDALAECIVYTPFIFLEEQSIDELDVFTIPGFTSFDDATVFLSLTYNGVSYTAEHILEYGGPTDYGQRFIAYALGYVSDWFAFKLRWASRSRMCWSLGKIRYG